jgi:EAL domain-containing protein (putative c-di-GMP-specific phosphodiesterase class I)
LAKAQIAVKQPRERHPETPQDKIRLAYRARLRHLEKGGIAYAQSPPGAGVRMFRLIAAPLIAGIAAGAAAWYLRSAMPAPLPALTLVEAVFAGVAMFVTLMVLAGHVQLQRLARQFRQRLDQVGAFEADLRRKVLDAETQMAGLALAAEVSQRQMETLQRVTMKLESAAMPKLPPEPAREAQASEKVVALEPIAKARAEKLGVFAEPASPKGETEIWFQPIVTLPARKTRFFDSLVYIRPAEGGPAARPVPAGRDVLALADTAETALVESLKLARELERADRPGGVIWHTNATIFADLAAHRRLKSVLEANSKIAGRLAPSISHKVFARLNRPALERLHAFKDLGYRIAVSDLPDAATVRASLKGGLFSMVIGEARQLIELGGGSAGPSGVRFQEFGVEAVATNVADEDTAMALIDQDILLAKGSLFAPPKPLKARAPAAAGNA